MLFGENSIIYNIRHKESVKTLEFSSLWALDKITFLQIKNEHSLNHSLQIYDFINQIEFFSY